MAYTVRNAAREDLARIEEIYAFARGFMLRTGNPNQWGTTEPPHDQLVEDIRNECLHVIEDETGIHGVFYFYIGADPTYDYIEEGSWRSDSLYGTIHRIAGDGSGGILRTAVTWCQSQINHIRIDTHHDNHVMQQAVAKQDFRKCGIIYIQDGTPRIAYDKLV